MEVRQVRTKYGGKEIGKSAYSFVGLSLFLQATRDPLRAGFFRLCLRVWLGTVTFDVLGRLIDAEARCQARLVGSRGYLAVLSFPSGRQWRRHCQLCPKGGPGGDERTERRQAEETVGLEGSAKKKKFGRLWAEKSRTSWEHEGWMTGCKREVNIPRSPGLATP